MRNTSLLEDDFKGLATRIQERRVKEIWVCGRRSEEIELETKVEEEAAEEFEKESDRDTLSEKQEEEEALGVKKGQSFKAEESNDILSKTHHLDFYAILQGQIVQTPHNSNFPMLSSPNSLSSKPYSHTLDLSKFEDVL
ncbi:hypothetical protein Csa_018379 [Cucumis sativus]|uniref:Uncharacterized protein n=1 Tax=Cucumis sativus TaxID=3659 RepID=A0A0A0KPM1_CUCSA|nr:hypothetical protein Csa_018379 [Cucumis sativus]